MSAGREVGRHFFIIFGRLKLLMMKRYSFLLFLFVFALQACAERKQYPKAPAYMHHPHGEFPISASYAFYSPYMTDRQFEWVKEAGFNNIMKSLDRKNTEALLEMAVRHDMPLFIGEWGINDPSRISGIVRRYKDNPLVWGYTLYDEPAASKFGFVAELADSVNTYSGGQNAYINLLPAVSAGALGSKDYRTYLEDYVETVNPPLISYDIYPVKQRKDGSIYVEPVYYETLETVRDVARESGRPFWSYVLSNKHWNYPKPTREFLRFQIFTALAYGAQGISYYTYLMPDFDKDAGEYSDAPIDWNGNRTDVWYMVSDVNREVRNLEKVFLGAEALEVAHTGTRIPDKTKRLEQLPAPFTVIDSDGEGVLVSRLRNGSDEYLMLVNRDVLNRQKVYLGRSRPVTRLYGNGKEKSEKTPYLTLEPGSYALYRLP